MRRSCPLGGCRTWSVESENRPQRGQFLPDLQPHSQAMGQKDGEKWTAAADLQPTISKSDSLPAGAMARILLGYGAISGKRKSLNRHYIFNGGAQGNWRIERMVPVRGEQLAKANYLDVRVDDTVVAAQTSWQLRGVVSNERYVTEEERVGLAARQAPLGRAGASHAVLIPIRKSVKWWSLAQDQRRAIIEEDSRHIAIGMEYLPAVARRLHHCRDLPGEQPFDFLTWFEFAPDQESAFDELLHRLRSTHEWDYVERELELRLVTAQGRR